MANTTPAIIDYGKRMLDAGFADKSFIEQWFVNTEKYIKLDFQEAGAIRIMQIALDGLSDYYRVNHAGIANNIYANNNNQNLAGARDGLARGNVQANWVTYYCKHLRGKQLPIDYIDDMEMAGRLIAVTLDEFIRTKYVPEFDTIGFSTLAGRTYATYGNQVTADYTSNPNTIIAGFDDGIAWLKQHGVPEEDIVLFVDPITMNLIRHTTELTHFVTPMDFTNSKGISFRLQSYNSMPIVEVPSDRFYTYAQTTENGVMPTANVSKRINFIIADRKCMIPVKKLEWSKTYGNDNGVTNFRGWLVDFLSYYDFIIPNKKVPGVYCSVSSSATMSNPLTNILNIGLVAGDASTLTAVAALDTTPTQIAGNLVYSATAFVVGNTYAVGATIFQVPTSSETGWYSQFTPSVTSAVYFALLDGQGVCRAVSAVIATVPQAQ